MSCVEGAVVAQVPGPNQYWEHIKSKDRAYFIGRDPDGLMVWQCEGDGIEVGNLDWSDWQHIPGCTGWDWEPETWPKFYVLDPTTVSSYDKDIAYARFDGYRTGETFSKNGTSHCWSTLFDPEGWIEVTEAEAKARVTKAIEPAGQWPKFYVCNLYSPGYYRCDSEYEVWHIAPEGTEKQKTPASTLSQKAIWTEVSEAEAKARLSPQPETCAMCGDPPIDGTAGCKDCTEYAVDAVKAPAEEFPQYWTTINSPKHRTAYVKRTDKASYEVVNKTGLVESIGFWGRTDCISRSRLTEQQAFDLLDKPGETFPQWYILQEDQRRSWIPDWAVKRTGEETSIRYARDEAGELYATNEPWTGAPDCWERCSEAEAIVRMGTLMFPRFPSETRRVPVKLWVTHRLNDEGGDWPVRATQADQTCQNWKEIKFDGNVAFIEVES